MATLLQEFLEKEKWQKSSRDVGCVTSSWKRMQRKQQKTSKNSSCGSSSSDASSTCGNRSASSTQATSSSNAPESCGSAVHKALPNKQLHFLLPPTNAAAAFLEEEEEELGVAVAPGHAEERNASSAQSRKPGLEQNSPSRLSSSPHLLCSSASPSPASVQTSTSSSHVGGETQQQEDVDQEPPRMQGQRDPRCSVKQLHKEQQNSSSNSSRRSDDSLSNGNGSCSHSSTSGRSESSSGTSVAVREDAMSSSSSVQTRKQQQQRQTRREGQQKPSPSAASTTTATTAKSSSAFSSSSSSASASSSYSPSPPSFSFVPCAAAASLPVLRHAAAIVEAVQQHQVTLVLGETGSGKTTQIPQLLHAAGFAATGVIGITQPRRVAAVSLAARVAQEIRARQKQQQEREQQQPRLQQQHRQQQQRQQQLPRESEEHQQLTERFAQQRCGPEQQQQHVNAAGEHQHEKDEEDEEGDEGRYRHGGVRVKTPGVTKRGNVVAGGEKRRVAIEVSGCSSKEQQQQNLGDEGTKQGAGTREGSAGSACWRTERKRVLRSEGEGVAKKLLRSRGATYSADADAEAGEAAVSRGTAGGEKTAVGESEGGELARARAGERAPAGAGDAGAGDSAAAATCGGEFVFGRSSVGGGRDGRLRGRRAAGTAACGGSQRSFSSSASLRGARDGAKETAAGGERGNEENMGLGGLVGYSVRFEDVSSRQTRIKFLTDGLLLREAIGDPLLLQYSVVIVDEAHERSLRSDVLLGYLKLLQQQQRRGNLRLLVMSATLDAKKFLSFFPEAKLLAVPGRSFPLKILHAAEPQEDYVEAALVAALQIHVSAVAGDILIFLPGQEDIEAVHVLLLEKRRLLRAAAALASSRVAALLQRTSSSSSAGETDQSSSAAAATSAAALHVAAAAPPAASAPLPAAAAEAAASAFSSSSSVSALCSSSSSAVAASSSSALPSSSSVNAVGTGAGGAAVRVCLRIGEQTFTQQLPLRDLVVCPLYAALPFDQQKAVFEPAPVGSRKIILATNIAETSITVQGIRYVIDSGLVKNKVVNHRSGIEALVVREISKESAAQRAGRAAREAPGSVYRLYTEETYEKFKTHREPEIVSSDLGQVYLELKALRVANPLEFPFLDPPSPEAFFNAGRTLHRIGALDAKGELTTVGRQLSALPLSPLLGKLLLESVRLGCTAEILTIVAMLSTESLWSSCRSVSGSRTQRLSDTRRRILIEQSDHLTLLNAYNKWCEASDQNAFCREYGLHSTALRRAAQIRQQLEELVKSSHIGAKEIKEGGSHDNWALVRQCLASGCWLNTARLQRDGISYVTTVQRLVAKLHPSSVLFGKTPLPGYIVYSEYVQTTKPYLRCVTAIEGGWLHQLVPRWFSAVENAV